MILEPVGPVKVAPPAELISLGEEAVHLRLVRSRPPWHVSAAVAREAGRCAPRPAAAAAAAAAAKAATAAALKAAAMAAAVLIAAAAAAEVL